MHVTLNLLVRDEADILEHNIRYHASIGVDRFLVMDHLSTDGTTEILSRLSMEYDIVTVPQKSPLYLQHEWMSQLGKLASEAGTDWIINGDADEFWHFPVPMKEFLASMPADADSLQCPWRNMVVERGVLPFFENVWYRVEKSPMYKTIMKPHKGVSISVGNHWVYSSKKPYYFGNVLVYHYSDRNSEKLYQKYVRGAEAVEKSGYPDHIAGHWRQGLAAFRLGTFEEFCEQVLLSVEKRRANGEDLAQDEAMRQLLRKIA